MENKEQFVIVMSCHDLKSIIIEKKKVGIRKTIPLLIVSVTQGEITVNLKVVFLSLLLLLD